MSDGGGLATRAAPEVQSLEAALLREQKKVALVQEVSRALTTIGDVDTLLRMIVERVTALMEADRATLYLVTDDGSELWSKIVQGDQAVEIRLSVGEGIAGWVAETREIVNIPDAYADQRFQPAVDLKSGYRTRSILSVPMIGALGGLVGVMQVLNKDGGPFTTSDEELLVAHLLSRILAQAITVLGGGAGSIALVESDGALRFRTVQGPAAPKLIERTLPHGTGLLGWSIAHKAPLVVDDPANDPRHAADVARETGVRPQHIMVAPLVDGEDVIGGIEIIDQRRAARDGAPWSEEDLKLLVLIAAQAAGAIGNARRRSEQARSDRLASIGRMLAGLLHDLKTPMTIISGYGQLMAASDDAAQREKYVELIQRQFDLMAGMTREVLAFARGDTDLVVRKVYVNRFVEELTTQLGAATGGRGIDFEVEARYDGIAYFDEQKLLRIFHNLARNAVEAMPDGGHLRVRVDRDGDWLVWTVSDAGPGVPLELRGRLFELFATGKKGGTGLGLAIVKKIVDDHHGTVACDTGDHGTTFTIRLPMQKPASEAD